MQIFQLFHISKLCYPLLQSPIMARMLTTISRPNPPMMSQRQPLMRQLASNLVRTQPNILAPRQPRALGRIPDKAQGIHPLISAFDVELEAAAVEFAAPAGAAAAAASSLHFGSLQ